jgi:hypothetical protein
MKKVFALVLTLVLTTALIPTALADTTVDNIGYIEYSNRQRHLDQGNLN